MKLYQIVSLFNRREFALLVFCMALSGCATFEVEPFAQPIRKPIAETPGASVATTQNASAAQPIGPQFGSLPKAEITQTHSMGEADDLGSNLAGESLTVSFNAIPLIAFINEVFGNQLGLAYSIAPALEKRTDLVTLRLTQPLSPNELFSTARSVLGQYGVGLKEQQGLIQFSASQDASGSEIPLLVSGRALPEVPASHRTIFQLVTLRVVRNTQVAGWIKQVFKGLDLSIQEDSERNALLLGGRREIVAQAVDMIGVLDQPMLKGRESMVVSPAYLKVGELASELDKVLKAEGYQTSFTPGSGSVLLLPLEDSGRLFVFAADKKVLQHIREWVKVLDIREQKTITSGLFTYQVKNAQAAQLVVTLNKLVGAPTASSAPTVAGAKKPAASPASGGSPIVVDETRNMIVFRGSGEQWGEILELMIELDKPVPEVLIEVLLAEITLGNEQGSGFEFLFKGSVGEYGASGGTLGALGVSGRGLSMLLDSAGATRAALNLFYEDSRVSIRSSPKLMVKSGAEATIEVGNEIPIISQNSVDDSVSGGNSNILQKVDYRKTGVILKIKPVVQANGLVDLEIAQELSEARTTATTSLEGSPTILRRSVETLVSLRDGSSLVLGGMISNSQSTGQTGVPFAAKIPLFGRLFRNETAQKDRTELIIMVIPYVVRNAEEGSQLTEQLKDTLELHKQFTPEP